MSDDGLDIVSGGVGTSAARAASAPSPSPSFSTPARAPSPSSHVPSVAAAGFAAAPVASAPPSASDVPRPSNPPAAAPGSAAPVELATRLVELDIPARADYVALVRQVVVASARTGSSLGEERLENLRLAVSEACTNAIHAHSAIGSEAQIHIRCHLSDDRIEVEVVDEGRGFDPARVPAVPAVGDPNRLHHETGLGIPLMQLFTDRAEIRSSSSGTNVRLVVLAMPVVGG